MKRTITSSTARQFRESFYNEGRMRSVEVVVTRAAPVFRHHVIVKGVEWAAEIELAEGQWD